MVDRHKYDLWISRNEPTDKELKLQEGEVFLFMPLISIITPVFETQKQFLIEMIDSVLSQTYINWELCIADGGSKSPHVKEILETYANRSERIKVKFLGENKGIAGNSNEAISLASGEYIALLDHDDVLPPFALYEVVKAINDNPEADLIYSDRDHISADSKKRFSPFFKPDWSPDYLLSLPYLAHLNVFRRTILQEVGGFRLGYDGSQDYDLVLRVTEKTDKITHIPKILYHWRVSESSVASGSQAKPYIFDASKRAIEDAIKRRGLTGEVKVLDDMKGFYWPFIKYSGEPKVSIIISTKDNTNKLDKCIKSIQAKTRYKNYEVVLIDYGSTDKGVFDSYESLRTFTPGLRILTYNKEQDAGCSFSSINNFAAAKTDTDILLFLEDDMEVITDRWLELMLGWGQRKETGAVGVKLLQHNNTIQHAGLVLGVAGLVGRSYYGFPRSYPGNFGRMRAVQNFSAITASCAMIKADKFWEIGGFDESYGVANWDVDFCLKLRDRGYLIVYLPYLELYCSKSKINIFEDNSKNSTMLREDNDILYKRWREVFLAGDHYYNPNLTQDKEDYSIRI